MNWVKAILFSVITTAAAIFVIKRIEPLNNLVFGA